MISPGFAWLTLAIALPLSSAAKQDPLSGRVAGPAQHCVSTFPSDESMTAIGHGTILYRENGRRQWVSHPQGVCPGLGELVTLIIERDTSSEICDTDRFRVLRLGETIPSGYCRFGPFTPYTKPAK